MSCRNLGDIVEFLSVKNEDGNADVLYGININKFFMPSVANIIGVDLKKYKIVRKNQFACNRMHVGRDKRLPVSMSTSEYNFIVSPAYDVFQVKDTAVLPEYLMLWFRRTEFDRQCWFYTDADVRGGLSLDALKSIEVHIPSIKEQQKIVAEYQSIANKIKVNEQICEKLEATVQTLYKHWFVDFEFPTSPPPEGCPKDGVVQDGSKKDGVVQDGTDQNQSQDSVIQDSVVHSRSSLSSTQPQPKKIPRATKNYYSLPYNPALKEKARALRKAGNLAEVLFWLQVKNKQFLGLDFDRQKIIGNYIVDFYNANHQVVIEIDGSSHDYKQEYDASREAYLESLGLTIIHFTDQEVLKNIDQVMHALENHAVFQGEEMAGEDVECDHPAFQAPLQRRGSLGYKSSGGEMVWNEELQKEIPVGWEMKSLGDITKLITDGKHGNSKDEEKSGYYFISAKDIKTQIIDYSEAREISFFDFNETHKRTDLKGGDILITNSGTIGKIAYIFSNKKNSYTTFQKSVAIIKSSAETNSYFLFQSVQFYLKDIIALAGGSTQNNLLLSDIRGFKILTPPFLLQTNYNNLAIYLAKLAYNKKKIIHQLNKLHSFLLCSLPKLTVHGNGKDIITDYGK